MAFQAVEDTAEIDIIYTLNAKFVQNTMYAKLPGGYQLADLQALADQVDIFVQGNFLAQQPPEALYVRTEVRGLAIENDQIAQASGGAGPGIQPGRALPNNVTFSVKKVSGLTGRSARGRLYWIGVPADQTKGVNENLLEAIYITAVEDAIEAVRVAIGAVPSWTPVLVSRFTGGVQRPFGVTFPWIGVVAVDNRVDTMRNRLPELL